MASRMFTVVALSALLACNGGDDDTDSMATSNTLSNPTMPMTTTGSATDMTDGTMGSSGATAMTSTTEGTAGPTTSPTGSTSTAGTDTDTSTDSNTATDTGGDFCEGEGPVPLPGDMDMECAEDIGKKTFLFAICSCSSVTSNNMVTTDAFDSEDMNMNQLTSGSIGVNGDYTMNLTTSIGGSVWTGDNLSSTNTLDVENQLRCGGTVDADGQTLVQGDAYVEQDILAPNGNMTIEGQLHIPQGNNYAGVNTNGGVVEEPVMVQTPCDCSDPLDIDSIVAAFAADNDNAENGFTEDQLSGLAGDTQIELPCGLYHFDEISANGSLSIVITGRVVIAVTGDISVAGPFSVVLQEGTELDMFVGGSASFMNTADIGDMMAPAATRIYVDDQVSFAGTFDLAANLYMPNATLMANNTVEVWGSLFVGGLSVAGPLTVHYDQAIQDLEGCQIPGDLCLDCHDCVNPTPACNGGVCGPCSTDADCCPPLVCETESGECKPTIG